MKRSRSKIGAVCCTTFVTAMNLLGVAPVLAQTYGANNPAAYGEPLLTTATSTTSVGATSAYFHDSGAQTQLTTAAKIALLQSQVKYVFVLFQENRAFDHYFGTYPGANGVLATYPGASGSDPYSQPASSLPSYTSLIRNTDGTYGNISPWLMPRTITNVSGATVQLYPESLYSVDHSHNGYMNDFHFDAATKSVVQNDGYPLDQEALHFSSNSSTSTSVVNASGVAPTTFPTLAAKQKGEVVMAHVDCDTIPFLWQYADRFTLFDNFHQTATGPSTPNAIALLAGQVGDTQWVKHPTQANASGPYLPMLSDAVPYPGSTSDTWSGKPPFGLDDGSYQASTNSFAATAPSSPFPLTFASLPLSFMGGQVGTILAGDQNPSVDLADTKKDVQTIAVKDQFVNWGWYEQGFGPEPFDGTSIYIDNINYTTSGAPVHGSLITHHVGPQYFGYLADNSNVYQPQVGTTTPNQPGNLHGLQQFYTDVVNTALPAAGGVFYVRGGYYNNDGLTPADPNTTVKHAFAGNDDHGSYSDSQIAEALVADSVNAIVNSPYWSQSAIIITYDESDGFYDHQPETFRTYGPDGNPETGGPRIPTIVISPFSVTHAVSHVYSEHSAVIKFIDELFNLVSLSALPDETSAQKSGKAYCATPPSGSTYSYCAPGSTAQANLGPADTAAMGDLTESFDNDRLLYASGGGANVAPLPASYAQIGTGIQASNTTTASLPHYSGQGCTTLAITPTNYPHGYSTGGEIDPPPVDFNPRPTVSTGSPFYNTSGNTAVCTASSTTSTNPSTTQCAQGTGSPWPN